MILHERTPYFNEPHRYNRYKLPIKVLPILSLRLKRQAAFSGIHRNVGFTDEGA